MPCSSHHALDQELYRSWTFQVLFNNIGHHQQAAIWMAIKHFIRCGIGLCLYGINSLSIKQERVSPPPEFLASPASVHGDVVLCVGVRSLVRSSNLFIPILSFQGLLLLNCCISRWMKCAGPSMSKPQDILVCKHLVISERRNVNPVR